MRSSAISASVMTPIVFCASFVPWASAISEADTIWPARNGLWVAGTSFGRAIR